MRRSTLFLALTPTQAFPCVLRASPRPAERSETTPSRDGRSHPLGQQADPSSPNPATSAAAIGTHGNLLHQYSGIARHALACNGCAVQCIKIPSCYWAVRRKITLGESLVILWRYW
jgi:hypothetical protein